MSFNSKWGKNPRSPGRRNPAPTQSRLQGPRTAHPSHLESLPPRDEKPPDSRWMSSVEHRSRGRTSFTTWLLVILGSMAAVVVAQVLIWLLTPVNTRGLTPFGQVLVQGERHAVLATHHPTRSVVATHHQTTGATHRSASPSPQTWTHRQPVTAQPASAQQGPGSGPAATPPPSGQGTAGTGAVQSQPGGGQASAPKATGVSPLSPASHAYLCWIERTPSGVDGC